MKLKINIFFIIFFLAIFSCIVSVYGDWYIQSDTINETDVEVHRDCNSSLSYITSNKQSSASEIANKVKVKLCEEMLKSAAEDFVNKDFIPVVKVKGGYYTAGYDRRSDGKVWLWHDFEKEYPITEVYQKCDEWINKPLNEVSMVVSFKIGDTDYSINMTTTVAHMTETVEGEEVLKEVKKSEIESNSIVKNTFKNQNTMAQNQLKFLETIESAAIEGIIAGSIGAGYNVATPYSTKQRPLTDVLELKGGYMETDENGNTTTSITHYDFKSMSDVKYAFSSYFSPLFGEIFAEELPQNKEEWISYANKNPGYVSGKSIVIHTEFSNFKGTFDSSTVNQAGYKEAEGIKIDGGAKRFDVSGSKDPGSVLSYMMPMYSPYVFSMNNGIGELMMNHLKPVENYKLCLYDNNIYSTTEIDENGVMKKISSMGEMGISHDYLYLYYTNVDIETTDSSGKATTKKSKKGVIIVAMYEECVVDTSNTAKENNTGMDEITFQTLNNMYLTGRKIGFLNGYSDSLNFERQNAKLMFVRGESGDEGYLPKNTAFPIYGLELKGYHLETTLNGELGVDLKNEVKDVEAFLNKLNELVKPKTNEETIEYSFDIKSHGALPNSCEGVYFLTGFGKFFDKTSSTSGENEGDSEGSRYMFYIIRNNKYIQDESLVNWLKSDSAASLSHVKNEELLSKILGDFTPNLDKLTYADWLEIQKIKRNLQHDKDMWLVRVINVTSLVFGVFLIIFAILFMMAYWIDVFNTFTDFSILQFVSFGNLYPITDDSTLPYLIETKGETKFVKFKDVLILAIIMMALGILFMNTDKVIELIVNIYNYVMYIFGGV